MSSIKADRNQMFLLPPAIEDWLPENHPARFIEAFVSAIDLKKIGFKDDLEEGRPSYSSEMLLSIWLYGLMISVKSTRKLETNLYNNIGMIWLTGCHYPDHNTIWRFYAANRNKIKEVFKSSVRTAIDNDMVGFELQAIDGTRIQADVNDDKTRTLNGQKKKLEEIENGIEKLMKEIEENEKSEDKSEDYGIPSRLKDKNKLKESIKRSLKMMEEEGATAINETDKDARFMKIRAIGIKPGYNAQAAVDEKNQIITGADVSNNNVDNKELTKMIQAAEETAGKSTAETVVDKGYYNAEELAKAEALNKKVIINVEAPDKGGKYGKSNFVYDEETNEYICPEGKRLRYCGKTIRKDRNNKEEFKYICKDYRNCCGHAQCTTSKKGRVIKAIKEERLISTLKERYITENWEKKLKLRKKIVEPVFGDTKEQIGLRRFSYRGLEKAKAQWYITCTIHNLKKIFKKMVKNEEEFRFNPV